MSEPIPSKDGKTKRIDNKGREVTVERKTTRSETDKERIEVITVVTTTEEPSETRTVTQTITERTNKITGNKTTKRARSTTVTKKTVQQDEEDEVIFADGISPYQDPETGIKGTREQKTKVLDTGRDILTIVTMTTVVDVVGQENMEKVVTIIHTTTKNKATGAVNVSDDKKTLVRRKSSLSVGEGVF
eukprot:TRINITY_DN820_c0_g1_i38.p2 TRINITY_DN820_c0_g1~~TRINITY_DN820_c0_g1_i38.p2  ORF type:complete len:188 (-),score=46.47 TRINITY_DN820_c0_g1_i38:302-865(-)